MMISAIARRQIGLFNRTFPLVAALAAALVGVPMSGQAAAQAPPPAAGPISDVVRRAPTLALVETKLRSQVPLTGVSALAGDRRGRLYVLHRPQSGDPVVVLDRKGRMLRSWGRGMFAIPHGVRIDPEGNVWTIDAHTSVVLKFSPEGRKLLQIDVGGVPDRARDFCGATDVAFAPGGHVLVSDGYCNGRVLEYDAKGAKVREWGGRGRGPGQFIIAHAIARAADGQLLVADRWNGRIQRFDASGRFLGLWTYGGELYSLAFDPKGRLYATLHEPGAPLDGGWTLIQVDPRTGAVLGRAAIAGGHELAVAPDGAILPATRSADVVLLRPR